MKTSRLALIGLLMIGSLPVLAGEKPDTEVQGISCMGIREEPGAPTFGFDLKSDGGLYVARYLNYPGDESLPPTEHAVIEDLACRFYNKNPLMFECTKQGATVEGVRIVESELSPIEDELITRTSYEMRATGNEVPDVYLVYRFNSWDTCQVMKPKG